MVYKGILNVDEYGCLECGSQYLIEQINDNFNKGDKVFVRYYLADKEISEEQANEAQIMKTLGGNVDELDFILGAYSEYTICEYNEELKIGGHDLFRELVGEEGKYLILVIEPAAK
ncbi:MAG: hypothetical protein ABIJ40_16495 [Bacteroidota bacterium]